jgi:thymidylate synthase
MKTPPTILIREESFHNAWARAVRQCLREGHKITIGDATEPKPIRDMCGIFELTGDAIRQIEDRELHDQFPFPHIDPYCEEFTPEFHAKWLADDEGTRHSYIYYDRLVRYGSDAYGFINQLASLRLQLKEEMESGISSNRHQGITWRPMHDDGHPASPCLQRIWIRYLGDRDVEVHLTWRSRDLYTAWQVNIIALIDMLNREVIRPNNCRIVKLVDYADSLHIYESDKEAEKVKLVPVMRGV